MQAILNDHAGCIFPTPALEQCFSTIQTPGFPNLNDMAWYQYLSLLWHEE